MNTEATIFIKDKYIDTTPAIGGPEHKFTKRQPLKWMLRQMVVDSFTNRDKFQSYEEEPGLTADQRAGKRECVKQYEADLEWMSDPSMHYERGFAFAAVCDWLEIDREYVLKQFLGGCRKKPPETRGGDWPIWGKKPHHLEEISIERAYQPMHSKHKWDRLRKERH